MLALLLLIPASNAFMQMTPMLLLVEMNTMLVAVHLNHIM